MGISNVLLHKLQADLKSFGLNPSDWTLFRSGKFLFEVRHVSDKDFAFKGRLDPKKSQGAWLSMELLSI